MKRFLYLLICLISTNAFGNNIQISNVSIASQSTALNFYMIEFDLSWENSWRTSTLESNHDAAWVFIKFTRKNQQAWTQARLTITPGANDGHIAPAGCTIEAATNTYGTNAATTGVGVFIYRSADGIGDVDFQNIQLRWNYGSSAIGDDEEVEISVHAIEMVYVPQGSFYLGDGGTTNRLKAGPTSEPFQITSETSLYILGGTSASAITAIASPSNYIDDFNTTTVRILPSAFPKGYDAFYCMKYEVSQGQYAEFLTTLTTTQRLLLDDVPSITSGSYFAVADNPWRALDGLTWLQVASYLDWAGLRPMSELEFEKACRGPLEAVEREYAWGNASWQQDTDLLYSFANSGTRNEIITGNLGVNTGNAQLVSPTNGKYAVRCGIFAASAENKTRQETGATYWGIMEMTANTWEAVIPISNADTRGFTGLHGNGIILSSGNFSGNLQTDWADLVGTDLIAKRYFVSDRSEYYAGLGWLGIRGARTSP